MGVGIWVLGIIRTVVVVGGPIAAICSVLVGCVPRSSLGLGCHYRGGRLGGGAAVGVPRVLLLGSDGHHEETQQEADPEMSGPWGMGARQHFYQ